MAEDRNTSREERKIIPPDIGEAHHRCCPCVLHEYMHHLAYLNINDVKISSLTDHCLTQLLANSSKYAGLPDEITGVYGCMVRNIKYV